MGATAPADLRAIFVEGDIANPVQAVLDLPMSADDRLEICDRGPFFIQARQAVVDFMSLEVPLQIGGNALDAKDLLDVWESEVVVQLAAGPEPANFDPAVAFVYRFMFWGGKPRRRGPARPEAASLLVLQR